VQIDTPQSYDVVANTSFTSFDESFKRRFTNAVAGVLELGAKGRDRGEYCVTPGDRIHLVCGRLASDCLGTSKGLLEPTSRS